MHEKHEFTQVPLETVALPMALLQAVGGRLWVRAASRAMLTQAGLETFDGEPFGFE